MAMTSEVQSQISKRNAIAIGGNLVVNGNSGGGAATAVFRHQIFSFYRGIYGFSWFTGINWGGNISVGHVLMYVI
jgi:hypothetical protein